MSQELKRKLFEYIDEHSDDIVEFLCRLIELKPVNPSMAPGDGDELAAQRWIKNKLLEFGFSKVDYWTADPEERRPNVVGTISGTGEGRSLIYNGHIDVVPVPEAQLIRWSVEPWKATIKNGIVYGRGASDMLGGIAAIVWAAKAIIDNDVTLGGDLYVESVVGEESNEGGSIGTIMTIDRGYRAPFAVITEPTAGEIQTVTCGTILFEMEIYGKETHTGAKNLTVFPQRYGIPQGSQVGVDAIAKAVKYILAFQEMERNWNFRWRHPLLGGGGHPIPIDKEGVGVFSITPTLINGGTYIASIPGYCKLTCQVYYPSWVDAREVWREIKSVIESVSSTDDWLREHPPILKVDSSIEGTAKYIPLWEANEIPIEHEGCRTLASAWKQVTGNDAIFSGLKAVCDVTYFGKKGIPATIFGPGDIFMGVHGPDEGIPIKNMVECCKTLAVMAVDWCGLADRHR